MEETLEALGLSRGDQAAYLALLDAHPATLSEVRAAAVAQVTAANLRSLTRCGLVSRRSGRPIRYAPVPPEVALELLMRSHEQSLQRARAGIARLAQRFRDGQMEQDLLDVIDVIVGAQAVTQQWHQLQRVATREICLLDLPPYFKDKEWGANKVESEQLHHGVRYRTVYDSGVLGVPGQLRDIESMARDGESARIADALPVKLAIVDGEAALLPLTSPDNPGEPARATGAHSLPSSLLVSPSSLLDALRELFELTWQRATPIARAAPLATASPGAGASVDLSATDRRVLELLAAGLTDAAIAHQLGRHHRSVQRDVAKLMARLGVSTRFQAGMWAAHKGWL